MGLPVAQRDAACNAPARSSAHAWLALTVNDIRQLASREVYRNPWLRVREDEVEFPDGSTGSYAVVEKNDDRCHEAELHRLHKQALGPLKSHKLALLFA